MHEHYHINSFKTFKSLCEEEIVLAFGMMFMKLKE